MSAEERQRHVRRLDALRTQRKSWDPHWRDLSDHVQPRQGKFFRANTYEAQQGQKMHQHIVNGTPTWALRTLAAGMMAGVTSPARPWFRLTTQDPKLAKVDGVKQWLHEVENLVLDAMARSNVYNSLHQLYADLALIGNGVMIVEQDEKQPIRAYLIPVGEYFLAASDRQQIDTLYRETALTVRQLARKFGIAACSYRVQELYKQRMFDTYIDVVHVIEPRQDYDPEKLDKKNKPWASCWFERDGSSEDGMLLESGYDEQPFVAPRWSIAGNEVYGSSPGMDALGDAKALQLYERRKAQAVERIVDPPLMGPGVLRNRPVSLLPGAINYVDANSPGQRMEPMVTVPPAVIQVAEASIREHEQRVKTAFFADLWLMLSQDTGPQMTAREVSERHEEKMLQLGPVMERLEDELLNPLIARVLAILARTGRLPPLPQEMKGQEMQVEYLSIMAQAQKMIAGTGIQQLAGFVGNLATAKPEALDVLDYDEVIEQYADALAVNPALIRTDDQVAQIRADRAKQQQAQQQQEQAMAAAQGAKTLSQADTSTDNGLTRMLGGVAGAQAAN